MCNFLVYLVWLAGMLSVCCVLCLICTGAVVVRASLTVTNCISVFLTSGLDWTGVLSGQARIERSPTTTTNTLSTPGARPDWVRGKCVENMTWPGTRHQELSTVMRTLLTSITVYDVRCMWVLTNISPSLPPWSQQTNQFISEDLLTDTVTQCSAQPGRKDPRIMVAPLTVTTHKL